MQNIRIIIATALLALPATVIAQPEQPAKPDAAAPAPAPNKAAPADEAVTQPATPDKPAPDKPADKPAPTEPSADDIEQAKQHYIRGSELFDAGKFTEAVGEFKESYRLSRNPLLLYNIGYTYDQLEETDMALFYYDKFLSDSGQGVPNRDVAKQRVNKLRRKQGADDIFSDKYSKGTEDASKAAPAAKEPAVTEFLHEVVEEAPPGTPLDIIAIIPDNASWKLTLHYRAAGESAFTSTLMKPRYKELVGRVPAAKLAASSVQYYIEVKDSSGKQIAGSGRRNSPNIVFVEANARPQYYPDFGDDRGYAGTQPTAGASAQPVPLATGSGWMDIGSDKNELLKWTATGTAFGLLTTATITYLVAANANSDLEGDAYESTNGGCGAQPCSVFGSYQQDMQSRGKRFQTIYRVSLGLGLASGGLAGYLWYKEMKATKHHSSSAAAATRTTTNNTVTVVPLFDTDFVGGAATLEF